GLMVPIRYPSSELTVDSVSFNGSIITSDYNGSVYLGDPGIIQITYILTSYQSPIPIIPMPNGIIATLYFGVSENAPEGLITIDSVNQESPIWRKIHLSDETGFETYLPGFVSGKVVVKMSLGVDNNFESGLPKEFSLTQNYPNPFNPSTIIEFALPKSGPVKLEVYNILGQTVNTLIDKTLGAGKHQVEFNASELPSGIYFYRLIHQDGSETKKMILVK
ncbi:MAG: T9SS type A sorting domain-containing protein, partial [Candidatus Zixiibacteriota bacterium]